MNKYILSLLFVSFLFFSCSNSKEEIIEENNQNSPFALSTNNVTFHENIAYGEFERNKFDLFTPDSDAKTPIVIYIHGGGFTGGSKSDLYQNFFFTNLVDNLLSENIAFASINYRLLETNETEGVFKCINDSKRALQYIRRFSNDYNINKDKVVLIGASAGAGTSLWIGFNSDLAQINHSDVVFRESTRINGIVALSTQANYDIPEWHNTIFKEYQPQGMSFEAILGLAQEETLLQFYGIDNISELNSSQILQDRSNLDMLELITSDDPEFYVSNADTPYSLPTNADQVLHHPLHAKAIIDKATEVNLSYKALIPQMNIDNTNGESMLDFILRKLNN